MAAYIIHKQRCSLQYNLSHHFRGLTHRNYLHLPWENHQFHEVGLMENQQVYHSHWNQIGHHWFNHRETQQGKIHHNQNHPQESQVELEWSFCCHFNNSSNSSWMLLILLDASGIKVLQLDDNLLPCISLVIAVKELSFRAVKFSILQKCHYFCVHCLYKNAGDVPSRDDLHNVKWARIPTWHVLPDV